jgi:hypothetical protein
LAKSVSAIEPFALLQRLNRRSELMRGHWAYLFGSGLGLAMLALVAGLQVRTVAASPQSLVQDATAGVNRSLKGDRLDLPTMSMSAKPTDRQGSQAKRGRLPDGCEAAVSAMTRSSLAQTPGRCIS